MSALKEQSVEEELKAIKRDSHKKKKPKFRTREGEVHVSKTISWVLRHGASTEGLPMREDGYAKVSDLLKIPRLRQLDFPKLEEIVQKDNKQRYSLLNDDGTWWIRANQGHSMKTVKLDLQEITRADEVPMAVHGTSLHAWKIIAHEGLSKMDRQHIHMAQGVHNVISGMRKSSDILIYIDVAAALDSDIKFYLSSNGVVLSAGDSEGYIRPQFFTRVEKHTRRGYTGFQGNGRVEKGMTEEQKREVLWLQGKPVVGKLEAQEPPVEMMGTLGIAAYPGPEVQDPGEPGFDAGAEDKAGGSEIRSRWEHEIREAGLVPSGNNDQGGIEREKQ